METHIAQLFLNLLPFSDIPNRFDSTCYIPVNIIQGSGLKPEKSSFFTYPGTKALTIKRIIFSPLYIGIFFFKVFLRLKYQIDYAHASFAVKRYGIFIITLPQNVFCFNTGQLFYSPVPGYYLPLKVNSKSCIG